MLKARVLTALILIPLVVLCILFLPPLAFFILAMGLILLAGWEWTHLAGIHSRKGQLIFMALLALVLLGAVFVPVWVIITIGIVWWLVALFLMAIYPKGTHRWAKNSQIRGLMGILTLLPCWIGLIILQGFSPLLFLFCLILIWGVDSAAYFVGRKWGHHKVVPALSPGKSYEGLLAGLLAAMIITVLGFWQLEIPSEDALLFFVFCLIGGGLVSVVGDFFESMMKRVSHVKDSGTLLPGHGGVLDRIDSMLTAIPFFALLLPYFLSH